MMTATALPRLDADAFISAYEEGRRRTGSARICDHLPSAQHPHRVAVLAELIRVELEFEWEAGRRPELADYLGEYPELPHDAEALGGVAFEEYRQRVASGDELSASAFAARYGVDAGEWDEVAPPEPDPMLRTAVTPAGGMSESVLQAALEYRDFRGDRGSADTPFATEDSFRLTPAAEVFARLHAADPDAAGRLSEAVLSFPEVGTAFLGFHLVGELGRGAFGRVYLARQNSLAGRLVALKVTADLSDEAQTLAQLQHTNIVPIYSTHRIGNLQAVCMPYFGATTLSDVLQQISESGCVPNSGLHLVSTLNNRKSRTQIDSQSRGPGRLPALEPLRAVRTPNAAGTHEILAKLTKLSYVDAALWLVGRLADGLAHAHGRGIIHRDLKPANVLITDEGQPMLLDFNLSETSAPGAAPMARIGGTLPYMAPEHLLAFRDGHGTVDARSDIYSLGLILFELLAGRPAFPIAKGSFKSVLDDMIVRRAALCPRVRAANASVSPAVEAIIRKCVHPDPARRYRSADDLRDDIERQLAHRPLAHAGNPSLRERTQKWARRHPQLSSFSAVGGLAATLLIAAGATLYGWRENVRSLEAGHGLVAFRDDMDDLRVRLHRTDLDRAGLDGNLRQCESTAGRYGLLTDPDWAERPSVRYLPEAERGRLREDLGELLYLYARATGEKAKHETDGAEKRRLATEALSISRRAEVEAGPSLTRSTALQQGRLYTLLGSPADAEPLLRKARETSVETARDCYLAGQELAAEGDYPRALALLDCSTRLDPESFPAWFVRGNCYQVLAQNDRAAECYSVCIALRKSHAQAWHNRGLVRLSQNKLPDALADFDEALRLEPDSADGYQDRGLARQRAGDLPGARADLDRSLELGNGRTRIDFARALVREQSGDLAGAKLDRAEGLKKQPDDELSWLSRAEARIPTDPTGAESDVEEALKLNPVSRPGLQLKAYLLMEAGKRDAAAELLDKAVGRYPEHVPFRAGRGVLHARMGKRDLAIRDAKESLLQDTSPSNFYQVAGIYALTSNTAPDDRRESLHLLRTALNAGFGFEYLDGDPDLEPIRKSAEFRELVAAARTASKTR